MGRTSFVAWLFVMAAACAVIALADRSWGWLAGGIVLALVAIYARRLLGREQQTGVAGPRLGFVGIAMLVMIAVMFALFWLQTSA